MDNIGHRIALSKPPFTPHIPLNMPLQAVVNSTSDLSFVSENVDTDLETMTCLLFNVLSSYVYCFSTKCSFIGKTWLMVE